MKEKYKHLLNFVANVLTLAMEAVCFGWVWYEIYVPQLNKANKFSMRGNWAVIGMYVLFVFFFTKVLGGYRIGYMRLSDIVLSQVLAVLLAMVVSYGVSMIVIKFLMQYIKRHNFNSFALYRIALGIIVLIVGFAVGL